MRIEPAPSEPWASGPRPAATAAPAPPDEAPEVRSRFQGFCRAGRGGCRTCPCGRSAACWSCRGGRPRPPAAGRPAAPSSVGDVVLEELRAEGRADAGGRLQVLDASTGCRAAGRAGVPRRSRASAARAAARAWSAVTVRKALSVGFRRSMRASTASVTSTGDSFFAR